MDDRAVLEGARWVVCRVVQSPTPDEVARLIASGDAAMVDRRLCVAEYECRSQEDSIIVMQRAQAERGGEWVAVVVVDPEDLASRR